MATTDIAAAVAAANPKSRRLRELVQAPDILVMPGAFDPLSALLFESMGFQAIQGSSGGIAASFGLRNGDNEVLGRDAMLDVYRRLTAAVHVPVNADGEKGYGGPDEVGETVRRFVLAGAAGMNMEDGDYHAFGAHPQLIPLERAVAKVRVVDAARRAIGSEFFLNARVDVFITGAEERAALAEAIRRGNAYAEAGADCIFFIRAGDAARIGTLVREIKAPVSVLAGPDSPPVRELEDLGVARVSYGVSFTRLAASAMQQLAAVLLEKGDPAPLLRGGLSMGDMAKFLKDALPE